LVDHPDKPIFFSDTRGRTMREECIYAMLRANGLDKNGRPMTVKGGIADIVRSIPQGRMLLAYSAGLHHVQTPGQRIPRIFKTVCMRLETIDIAAYRNRLMDRHGADGFKKALVRDLEYRRDRHCFGLAPASPPLYAASRG
jgi:hypothetical protein